MALRQPAPGLDPSQAIPPGNKTAIQWRTYQCELVTPLYGGGVEGGQVDESMPIRASAIRGQLRFWWRLLAKYKWKLGTVDEIRRQEFLIWGGIGETALASQVYLRVEDINGDISPEACQEIIREAKRDGRVVERLRWMDWAEPYAYALFPAQGRLERGDPKDPAKLVRPGLRWVLRVGCTSEAFDVQVLEALRWWSSFGGVGARTRRGVGAVLVSGIEPVNQEEIELAQCQLFFSGPGSAAPLEAWQIALAKLRAFRQDEGIGRNSGRTNSRPGRSRWPEPASIRALTKIHRIKQDGTSFEPPKNTPPLFPRAVFGLPIVFQFQKEKSDQKSDPPVHTLEPGEVNGKRIERMASSLIIRPYLDKAGRWHAAVLALPNRLDAHAPLVLRQDRQAVGVGHILPRNDSENSFVPVDIPMKGRANNPLDAFLHYFQGKAASHGGGK
jgi:CRISPR-associated protein Cmr1